MQAQPSLITNVSGPETTQERIRASLSLIETVMMSSFGPDTGHALVCEAQHEGSYVAPSRDGMETLKRVRFGDHLGESVRTMVLEACRAQAARAGDGTTTTALMIADLHRRLTEDHARPASRRVGAMRAAASAIYARAQEAIQTRAPRDEDVKALLHVASSGDADLSKVLWDWYEQNRGARPTFKLDYGTLGAESDWTKVGGVRSAAFLPGFSADFSVHDDGRVETAQKVLVFVALSALEDPEGQEIIPGAMEDLFKYCIESRSQAVLIAPGFSTKAQDVFRALAAHSRQNNMPPVIIPLMHMAGSPEERAALRDLAASAGCVPWSAGGSFPLSDSLESYLLPIEDREKQKYAWGSAVSVTATVNDSFFSFKEGGADQRVTLRVGGETYAEQQERLRRAEDATQALASALRGGVTGHGLDGLHGALWSFENRCRDQKEALLLSCVMETVQTLRGLVDGSKVYGRPELEGAWASPAESQLESLRLSMSVAINLAATGAYIAPSIVSYGDA